MNEFFLAKDGSSGPNKLILEKNGVIFNHIDILNHTYSVYVEDPEKLSTVDKLIRTGITTIPIIELDHLPKYRKNFKKVINSFQEYKKSNPIVYVINKSGNLGNPSSYHNMFVRNLRILAFEKVYPIFQKYISLNPNYKAKKVYLQELADRMMLRSIGQTPKKESWHRDVIPQKYIEKEDDLFGGWINLDDEDQYFMCIPGSHLNVRLSKLDEGFSEIEVNIKKNLKKEGHDQKYITQKTKEILNSITKYGKKIRVPPGHIIIFPQYILHSIAQSKAKYEMFRLFTGWRLTVDQKIEHHIVYNKKLFDDQAPIPLPGGMRPSMYTGNHTRYYLNKQFEIYPGIKKTLIEWAEDTFVDKVLVERIDKKTNEIYKIVAKDMGSLKEYNLKLYPKYSDDEWSIYKGKLL